MEVYQCEKGILKGRSPHVQGAGDPKGSKKSVPPDYPSSWFNYSIEVIMSILIVDFHEIQSNIGEWWFYKCKIGLNDKSWDKKKYQMGCHWRKVGPSEPQNVGVQLLIIREYFPLFIYYGIWVWTQLDPSQTRWLTLKCGLVVKSNYQLETKGYP